jgi:tetratricopeptide (TPR) repeat protein
VIPILLALALQASTPPPPAAEAAALARYRECTALVTTSPDRAIETANAWLIEGGGLYARACLGLAYTALDRWAPAATVYEQAARAAESANDPRRADLWVQSANAWLAAGEPARAIQAFDSALATASLGDELRGEAHIDRARAQVALGNNAGARQDLDRALRLVADDPMAWYLSAGLALRGNDLARAGTDIARARALGADNPDILLLAGTIAGRAGNMEEAERLYRRIVEQAPESEAGRQARESLATLREVEVSAPAMAQPQSAPLPPRLPYSLPADTEPGTVPRTGRG